MKRFWAFLLGVGLWLLPAAAFAFGSSQEAAPAFQAQIPQGPGVDQLVDTWEPLPAPSASQLVDTWEPLPAPSASQLVDTSRFVFGSEFEVSPRAGVYGALSLTLSPFGILGDSGVRVQIGGVTQRLDYVSRDGLKISGTVQQGNFLAGYAVVQGHLTLEAYAGPIVLGGVAGQGTETGAQFVGVAEYQPDKDILVDAYGSISSIARIYDTDLMAGYAVISGVYLGPEIELSGSNDSTTLRTGLHLTTQIYKIEFGALLGFEQDFASGDNARGAYTGLNVSYRW